MVGDRIRKHKHRFRPRSGQLAPEVRHRDDATNDDALRARKVEILGDDQARILGVARARRLLLLRTRDRRGGGGLRGGRGDGARGGSCDSGEGDDSVGLPKRTSAQLLEKEKIGRAHV